MRSIRSFPCSYRLDTLPLNVGETMSDDGRYATQIAVVKEECKDADDAVIINTSTLSIKEVVEKIQSIVKDDA